jgi:hypothetical protein
VWWNVPISLWVAKARGSRQRKAAAAAASVRIPPCPHPQLIAPRVSRCGQGSRAAVADCWTELGCKNSPSVALRLRVTAAAHSAAAAPARQG